MCEYCSDQLLPCLKMAAQLEYICELERRVDEQERIIKRREDTIFRLVDELHGAEELP